MRHLSIPATSGTMKKTRESIPVMLPMQCSGARDRISPVLLTLNPKSSSCAFLLMLALGCAVRRSYSSLASSVLSKKKEKKQRSCRRSYSSSLSKKRTLGRTLSSEEALLGLLSFPHLAAKHTAVLYSTVHHMRAQYSTLQDSSVSHSTVDVSAVQYSTVHYGTVQHCTTHSLT